MSSLDSSSDEDDVSHSRGNQVKPVPATGRKYSTGDGSAELGNDTKEVMKAMDHAMSGKRRKRLKLGADGQILDNQTASLRERVKDFMDDSHSSCAATA